MKRLSAAVLACLLLSCSGEDDPQPGDTSLYFPPLGQEQWETVTPASLGWDESKVSALNNFLRESNTRAFIVMKNGRIVLEEYMNTSFACTPFNATSNWYWASAGKTLTSALVGIAVGQDKLDLQATTTSYLGSGWTSLSAADENKITVRHHLTMTTGLDDGVAEPDCSAPACLQLKAAPWSRWAYHNGAYTMLDRIITAATEQPMSVYFNEELRDKIGMDGFWLVTGLNNVYYSTPRAMARFGLLLLNKGKWEDNQVIPQPYFEEMVSTSQTQNQSYGYLTWLNGKSSSMVPRSQVVFAVSIAPDAPADMFAAIGRNGQLINVVPSQNLVVIRMGDVPDESLVPFTFQNELWKYLGEVIK